MSIISAGTTTTTALSSTGNTDGTLQFQVNGTTASVTLNTLGAIGVGSSPSFGTAGQVLTSGGSTVAPTWATPSAGGSAATPTALGTVYGSMTTSGAAPYLTAVGYAAGASNSGTGSQGTTAFGWSALTANTSGAENTAMGSAVMYGNTTGAGNTAMGFNTLITNISGSNNTAIGASALRLNNTGFSMTCVGYQAGYSNVSGGYSTYIGKQAGYSATGSGNVFIGDNAGYNSTGSNNVFIGNGPAASGYAMTTGSKNTILGGYSGNQGGLDIRTASNFIMLADGDGNVRGYYNNNLGGSSGYNWQFNNGGAAASTVVNITNSNASTPYGIYTLFSGAAPNNTTNYFLSCNDNATSCFTIWSNGTTSGRSDSRLKKNIADATPKLNDLCRLQVRNYEWETSIGGSKEIGLIAQEVEQIFPNLVVTHDIEKDGDDYKEVKYSVFVPMLIKAIQELKAEFDAYKASHP